MNSHEGSAANHELEVRTSRANFSNLRHALVVQVKSHFIRLLQGSSCITVLLNNVDI